MGRLSGKIALITGGSRGQGAAEARLFAAEGAALMIADVLDTEGSALARELRDGGAAVDYQHLDVTQPADWHAAVNQLRGRLGRLDILINNAGISQGSGLMDATLDDWERVLCVNLTGPFLGIQASVPAMTQGGAIVNISSIAGMVGYRAAAYAASKWGLRGLSHSAALDLVDRGIRVNSVHPGLVDTPLLGNRTVFIEAMTKLTPMQRAGSADEIAKLVLFLASDDASFITGAEIAIDGGFIAGAAIKDIMRTLQASGA